MLLYADELEFNSQIYSLSKKKIIMYFFRNTFIKGNSLAWEFDISEILMKMKFFG